MPLGECLLHPFEMVDLDVLTEVLLIQHGHRENVEDVARHIDKRGAHKLLCLRFVNVERRHHMLYSAAAHLRDQEIVEIAEHPARSEQDGTRGAARDPA